MARNCLFLSQECEIRSTSFHPAWMKEKQPEWPATICCDEWFFKTVCLLLCSELLLIDFGLTPTYRGWPHLCKVGITDTSKPRHIAISFRYWGFLIVRWWNANVNEWIFKRLPSNQGLEDNKFLHRRFKKQKNDREPIPEISLLDKQPLASGASVSETWRMGHEWRLTRRFTCECR